MTIIPDSLKIGAVALVAVAVVGCGGTAATPTPEPSPSPAPEAAGLVVEASEFKFVSPDLTIGSEGSTTITLVNKGTVEHDFTIDELESIQIAVAVGETGEGTLTDPATGTYEFYCTVPGHKAAGMFGTIVIEP